MRISYWSSDVCSADLGAADADGAAGLQCLCQLSRGEQGALAADGAALGREDSGRDCAGVGILVAGRAAGGGSETPVGVIEQLRERSEEHTSELQSLMRISYAVFCLKNNKT